MASGLIMKFPGVALITGAGGTGKTPSISEALFFIKLFGRLLHVFTHV